MALNNITVAVSADFFTAFASIPRKQQPKVLTFVNKFRTNPTASGINYEKINAARDSNLRSVRIGDTYRGIVMKPCAGNVYMLLWVDHHDKAYAWARNRICDINPKTGSIQVYQVEEHSGPAPQQEQPVNEPGLFDSIRDRELLRLGIPKAQIGLVHTIKTISDLNAAENKLPRDSFEALHFLAQGDKLEDVLSLIESYRDEAETIDGNDFTKALHNPLTLQKFTVAPSEHELEAMLSAPLEKWRVFLHPSQRAMVRRNWNGPVRLLGGAGTGKTVVALHRAKWLAENICHDEGKILLTTFTRNLAADIENNMKSICSRQTMSRIRVVNLDKWVSDFLRKADYDFEIDYDGRTRALWNQAMETLPAQGLEGFSPQFYREEWEHVIQPREVMTLKEYFKVSRAGRGTPMGRKERKLIWPLFEEYRVLLNEHRLREPADAMREARQIVTVSGRLPFRHIIVDEAQDMSKQAFLLLRAMVAEGENDLFITGDAHQRIYGHKVVLGRCGINIRGRSRKLRINYRTTEEIRAWAAAMMAGMDIDDLDDGTDSNQGYTSLLHGAKPVQLRLETADEEIHAMADHLRNLEQEGTPLTTVCIALRSNRLADEYNERLQRLDIPTYRLSKDNSDDRSREGVRVATMHRVKGLEFEVMIIAGVDGKVGTRPKTDDPVIRKMQEAQEKALLYVAATRAKKGLMVSGKAMSFNWFPDSGRR